MKKIVTVVLTILLLALSVTPVAIAETDCEKKICEMAMENDNVTDAKCLIYKRVAVVAVKTEKFSAKSQYDTFVNTLISKIKSVCELDHVFVTRNPKVMAQIEELSELDDDAREETIKKIIEEVTRRHPRKIDIPKITFGK